MTSSPENTAFVLVPGGYCPASLYNDVTKLLIRLGYTVAESDHPTVTWENKSAATFQDDVEQVQSLATKYLNQGKRVIVVGNSYGGFVITEAAKGLSERERTAVGKSGGLTNLVYFGSLLPPEMMTCTELISKIVDVATDSDADIVDPPPADKAGTMLMPSLSEEKQLYYGKKLQSQAKAAFHSRLTYLGYLHVPTTSIITLRDRATPPQFQHEFTDHVVAAGHTNVVKRTIDADHCAMCSHPKEIADMLVDIANSNVAR